MGHGGHGGVADLQAHGGDVPDADQDVGLQVLVGDVEDGRVEDGAGVVDLLDHQPVGEGRDVQHVQEGGLGHTDPVAGRDQVDVRDDFNRTLGNLGGDVQGLKERSLFGSKAGVLAGDHDIQGGEGASLCGGLDLVVQQHVPDGDEVLLGEDEADVALDVVEQVLELGVVGQVAADGLAHHGVFAHEDAGMASEGNADLLHLLGSDIVSIDLKFNNSKDQLFMLHLI